MRSRWLAIAVLSGLLAQTASCGKVEGGALEPAPSDRAAAAIAACKAGMVGADKLTTGEWTSQFARSCGGLFADARCREAWLDSPGQPPQAKLTSIIEPCRAAYCPGLPEPKPELCSVVGPVPPGQHSLWAPFERLVLSRDLGLSEPAVAALVSELPRPGVVHEDGPILVPRPAIGPVAGSDVIAIAPTPSGVRLSYVGATAEFRADDEAGVTEWVTARLAGTADVVLVVEADIATDFRTVRAVLAGANADGRTHIEFRTQPPPR